MKLALEILTELERDRSPRASRRSEPPPHAIAIAHQQSKR